MKVKVEARKLRGIIKILERLAGKSLPVLLRANPYSKRVEILGGVEGNRVNPSRRPGFALMVGLDATVDEKGEAVLVIADLKRSLNGQSGEVEIFADTEKVVLRGNSTDSVMKTVSESVITPEVPVGTVKVSVPAHELAEGIELCFPSVDKGGYTLSGIHLESAFPEEGLRLVASDGQVLSITEIPWSAGKDPEFGQLIVPWKICRAIGELIRLFSEEPVVVLGCFRGEKPHDDLFKAESVDWKLTAKPVEAVYPDISQAVPLKGLRVVVSAEEFESVLKPFAKLRQGRAIAEMSSDENALVFEWEGRVIRVQAEKEVTFFKVLVDMALLARTVKGRKGKMIIHLTKSLGTFQFGNRPRDFEMVAWRGKPEETVFPEEDSFSLVPSAKKVAEWREIVVLEKEYRPLRAEVKKLKELLREAEESNEFLLRQIKELRIENDYLRHGEIPLEPVEGGAKAVLWRKTLIIRDGLIFKDDGNGGVPIGRYDRETGTGLIEGLPVRLRRNGRGWLLVV